MVYKSCENRNFEDLAIGKVIVHRAGYPYFPVRLAQEIFSGCLHYLDDPDRVCIYDPYCDGGYLLTVLGVEWQHGNKDNINLLDQLFFSFAISIPLSFNYSKSQ